MESSEFNGLLTALASGDAQAEIRYNELLSGNPGVVFNGLGLPAYQFIQDELEYGRTYHTVMDTYERLSLEDLKVDAVIVAWLALNAAMDDARIPTKPGLPAPAASGRPF